jgi:hypothetical protein
MAAPTTSAKLGLLVDPDGESFIGTSYANWDKVDIVAGVQHTTAGGSATFPFEGALVAEKGTGITYTLTSDGSGGWNKRYITYPYAYCAATATMVANASGSYTPWGWDSYHPELSVNSGVSDMGIYNGWKCPVKGVYDINVVQRWLAPGGLLKCLSLRINGVDYTHMDNRQLTNSVGDTTMHLKYSALFNVNDMVASVYQSFGGNHTMYNSVFISMVRPVA